MSRLIVLARWLCWLACVSVALPAAAQQSGDRGEVVFEEYTPTIWIDPDGCEHWVFDDGFEGFMTPHRRRDGSPVCRRVEVCGIMNMDTNFATNQVTVVASKRARLEVFFDEIDAETVLIHGHTDARASDEYNMQLSQRRADAVARIARARGVAVLESRGFGERRPAKPGTHAAAYAANRRVEIICLR